MYNPSFQAISVSFSPTIWSYVLLGTHLFNPKNEFCPFGVVWNLAYYIEIQQKLEASKE